MENFISQSELEGRKEVDSSLLIDNNTTNVNVATVILKTGFHSENDNGELAYKVMLFENKGVKCYYEIK